MQGFSVGFWSGFELELGQCVPFGNVQRGAVFRGSWPVASPSESELLPTMDATPGSDVQELKQRSIEMTGCYPVPPSGAASSGFTSHEWAVKQTAA